MYKTDKTFACLPAALCSGPFFAIGKIFGLGCSLFGARCYVGNDAQTIACCCVESGNRAEH